MKEAIQKIKNFAEALKRRKALREESKGMRAEAQKYYTEGAKTTKEEEEEGKANEWTRYNVHAIVDPAIQSIKTTDPDFEKSANMLEVRDILSEVTRASAKRVGEARRAGKVTIEARQTNDITQAMYGRVSSALKLEKPLDAQEVRDIVDAAQYESLLYMVAEDLGNMGERVEVPNKIDPEGIRTHLAETAKRLKEAGKPDYFEEKIADMVISGPNIEGTEAERVLDLVLRVENAAFLGGQGERAWDENKDTRITRTTYAAIDTHKLSLFKKIVKLFPEHPQKRYIALLYVNFEVWKDLIEARKPVAKP